MSDNRRLAADAGAFVFLTAAFKGERGTKLKECDAHAKTFPCLFCACSPPADGSSVSRFIAHFNLQLATTHFSFTAGIGANRCGELYALLGNVSRLKRADLVRILSMSYVGECLMTFIC